MFILDIPKTKNSNYKFIKLIISKYFTAWSFIFWIIGTILIIKGYYPDFIGTLLLYTLTTVSIIGFIITYIHPRYNYLRTKDKKFGFYLSGIPLMCIDLLFHQIPLITHMVYHQAGYWKYYTKSYYPIIVYAMIMLCYMICQNPFDIYLKPISDQDQKRIINMKTNKN